MRRDSLKKAYQAFALFGSFGFLMGASILVGFFLGSFLDKRLGTEPWLLIIFLFLAIAGGFIEFFRTFQRFTALDSKDKGRNRGRTP